MVAAFVTVTETSGLVLPMNAVGSSGVYVAAIACVAISSVDMVIVPDRR